MDVVGLPLTSEVNEDEESGSGREWALFERATKRLLHQYHRL